MKLTITTGMAEFDAVEWNALSGTHSPFLCYQFLSALEKHGCVREQHGWLPRHLAARDDNDQLIGAVPLYLKDNSYGEFVFDWAWADAYHRNGLNYYPKAVVAIPYTPATGARLLTHKDANRNEVAGQLLRLAEAFAADNKLSSLHFLFLDEQDRPFFEGDHFMPRTDCQFHWKNRQYADFEGFLSALNARKRKKIKRERRYVEDENIKISILHGHEADDDVWAIMYHFYCSTFEKKSGYPTLSLAFFKEVSQTMGDQVVLIIARHAAQIVAGAICFRSDDTLYGRHWGCTEEFHSLHFEVCYYQGIDYCIQHGLQTFEPGAQGEHKLSRGFLPVKTHSRHWIAHEGFREAIDRYLQQERDSIDDYYDSLMARSPYKKTE
ncbi:MAG: GNAT family N-acetyltransferase [Gammaproteobacteria bacterium]